MPFNFSVGLPGPFTYSRRIGGGPSTRPTVAELRAHSRAADALPDEVLRVRNTVDWLLVVPFALLMLWVGHPVTLAAGAAVAVAVYLRHRARARKRARLADPAPAAVAAGRHRR